MKTYIVVEIDHKKPLPTRQDITDIAAQRIYGWLYSQGVEVGIRAELKQDGEISLGSQEVVRT